MPFERDTARLLYGNRAVVMGRAIECLVLNLPVSSFPGSSAPISSYSDRPLICSSLALHVQVFFCWSFNHQEQTWTNKQPKATWESQPKG